MTQDTEEEVGKLFVGGLSWETTKEKLNDYFSQFGEIADCVVMKNPETGRSRGFGFVTFKDPNCVQAVLNAGSHHLDERTIDPKSCNPKSAQKGKRDAKMSSYPKIFLGGLPSDVNETVLRQFFTKYGKVVEVVIMYDQERKKTRGNGFRGFGFLSFENEEAVNKVVDEHYVVISGKKVEVKRAEPRDKTLNGLKLTTNGNTVDTSADNPVGNGISVIPSAWWTHAHLNHLNHQPLPPGALAPVHPPSTPHHSHQGSLAAAVAAAAAAAAAAVNNNVGGSTTVNLNSPHTQVSPSTIGLAPGTGLIQAVAAPSPYHPMWASLPGWVPTGSPTTGHHHHRLTANGPATPALGSPSVATIPNFGSPNVPNVPQIPGPPLPHSSTWNHGHPHSFYPAPTPYPPTAWHPSTYSYQGPGPLNSLPHGLWPGQPYSLYNSSYPVGYSSYLPGAPISPGLSPSNINASINIPTVTVSSGQQTGSYLNAQPANHLPTQNVTNLPASSQGTPNSNSENCLPSSNAHETGNGQTNGLMNRTNQQCQSARDYGRDVSTAASYTPARIYGCNTTNELTASTNNRNSGNNNNNNNKQSGIGNLANSNLAPQSGHAGGPSYTRSSTSIASYHPYRRT